MIYYKALQNSFCSKLPIYLMSGMNLLFQMSLSVKIKKSSNRIFNLSRFYRMEFCLPHWWRIAVFIIICMYYTQWGGILTKIRMSYSTTTNRRTFQQHMWNFRVTFYALTKSQHCGLLIWLCWWPKWNSMLGWPQKLSWI